MGIPPLTRAEAAEPAAFVVEALELIPAVQHDFKMKMSGESRLVLMIGQLMMPGRPPFAEPEGLHAALLAMWVRLDFHVALAAHGVDAASVAALKTHEAARKAGAVADAEAGPGLRECAMATCGKREVSRMEFKVCSRCRGVTYCCAEHQREDWRRHKRSCTKVQT
jgi:hypothetical protein